MATLAEVPVAARAACDCTHMAPVGRSTRGFLEQMVAVAVEAAEVAPSSKRGCTWAHSAAHSRHNLDMGHGS